MADFQFGALPPAETEWQMDKTAASVAFVNEAEGRLPELHGEQYTQLATTIAAIKRGEKVLTSWIKIDDFLANPTLI